MLTEATDKPEQWAVDVWRDAYSAVYGCEPTHQADAYVNAYRIIQRAFEDQTRELREAGQFLLDRLVDHEVRMTSDDDAREWHGHVTPATSRFRQALGERP